MSKHAIVTTAVLGAIGLIAACSSPADIGAFNGPEGDSGAECTPRDKQACTCDDGTMSTKSCSSAGKFLDCVCMPKKATCGDGTCDASESCTDCPSDCGACPTCAEARSCMSGAAAPGKLTPTPSLNVKMEAMPKERILANLVAAAERGAPGLRALADAVSTEPPSSPAVAKLRAVLSTNTKISTVLRRQLARPALAAAFARSRVAPGRRLPASMPIIPQTMSGDAGTLPDGGGLGDAGDSGTPHVACTAPRLRVRMSKVTVFDNEDYFAKDIVYCFLTSESPAASEGVQGTHTAPTENLDAGQSHEYSGNEAIFWGVKEPKDAAGDLTLKYECWEQDDPTQYAALVQKLAQLGADEYAYQEGNGWTSSALDLAARFLPAIVSLDGDDHLFSASQVIPRSAQLGLANGASWMVRKSGTHLGVHWDWGLTIEAWGCADNGYVQ